VEVSTFPANLRLWSVNASIHSINFMLVNGRSASSPNGCRFTIEAMDSGEFMGDLDVSVQKLELIFRALNWEIQSSAQTSIVNCRF
jgi:hypothetical protein